MNKKLYCLIMAGGEGKRFWPKNKKKKGVSKQFFSIRGKSSMLEVTFQRMKRVTSSKRIFIVINKKQAVFAKKKIPSLRQDAFILEPFGRNTAAAIGLAALHLQIKDPSAIMLVSPCDHIIKNNKKFLQAVSLAVKTAVSGSLLVTIGIEPAHPDVEYGYIKIKRHPSTSSLDKLGTSPGAGKTEDTPRLRPSTSSGLRPGQGDQKNKIFKVEKFTEKPDRKTAERFLKSGDYFWNSGIFAWKAQVILDAIAEYMPELFKALLEVKSSFGLPEQEEVLNRAYSRLKCVPIDSGIMEQAENVVSLKADFGWDDLGHWEDARKYAKDFRIRHRTKKNRPGSKR
ncbi:MAG: mannose-1-phosphate guanylyltransferase [Candidatus Omnitrophota bacterium]|nr:mannose-1-phosphate guanylyltransferase [Candidatus Omnitrophota bacterium]